MKTLLSLLLFVATLVQAETQYIGLGGGELGIGTTEFLSHYHGCSGVQSASAGTAGGTEIVLVKCSDRIFVGKLGGSPPSGARPPARPSGGPTTPVIPPGTTGPANDDPWMGTDTPNWWITTRTDGSKVYVFDQMGTNGAGRRDYVPGCLNYQEVIGGSSAPCHSGTYTGITTTGATDTFAFDGIDSDSNTLAIRYVANDNGTTHPSNYMFHLVGPYGGGTPDPYKMWLTQDVFETFEAARTRNAACAVVTPYLRTSSKDGLPSCAVVAGERYYLLIRAGAGSFYQLDPSFEMENDNTNMGNPPITTGPASGDPGYKSNKLWIPSSFVASPLNNSSLVVADTGAAVKLAYVPGCLNGLGTTGFNTGCAANFTYTAIPSGLSENYTVTLGPTKTLSLRLKSNTQLSTSAKAIKLSGSDGSSNLPKNVKIWLTRDPTQSYANTETRCKMEGNQNLAVVTHKDGGTFCPLSADTLYYFNFTMTEVCSNCKFQVDYISSDFQP
jgi:hypothetical protein